MDTLELYIPKLDELWFYQKMTSDPDTMSYNANWDIDSADYHKDTGCIDFPESEWADWYAYWIGNEPKRFFAYIRRIIDGVWIGNVNFHYTPEKDWWDMGVVIYAPYRGKGYAAPSLRLMLDHAFQKCGVSRIHNDFETTRVAAWKAHLAAGFRDAEVDNGIRHMMITREEYLCNLSFADKIKNLPEYIWRSERVSIRPIENEDDLWYAVAECRLNPEQEDYVNPAGFSIGRAYLTPQNNVPCVICDRDGDRIGFISLLKWLGEGDAVSWSYYIDRKFQGMGYGKAAAELAVKILKTADPQTPIKLATEADNAKAHKLYESVGFRRSDEMDGDDWVFEL